MRIIARLDIKNGKLIKGIMMEGLRVLGDASDYSSKYQKMGISEIFYIDNVASLYGRNNLIPLIKEHVKNCRIPVTVGGGISEIENVLNLMQVGADKIVINSNALINPKIIRDIANIFGSQAIAVSIQVIKIGNKYEIRSHGGREKSDRILLDWIHEIQSLGCGEIFITAIHRDGTLKGPDINLLETIKTSCRVPLIYSGGISTEDQINFLKENNLCDGVAIGKALHIGRIDKNIISSFSSDFTIPCKFDKSSYDKFHRTTKKINIAVVKPDFANIGSLLNLLKDLNLNFKIHEKYNKEIENSELIILPGVGSFPTGMNFLKASKLDKFLIQRFYLGKPIMGICLGMQLLFDSSEEIITTKGLGILKGDIISLANKDDNLKLNIGWRKIYNQNNELTSTAYFIHSYGLLINHNFDEVLTASFEDKKFIAEVKNKNVCGFQYHPEKSSKYGKERFLYRLHQLAELI